MSNSKKDNTTMHPTNVSSTPSAGQQVFQSNCANPFIVSGGSSLWRSNELLLQDPKLRQLAGVTQIDQSVTNGYAANPKKSRY